MSFSSEQRGSLHSLSFRKYIKDAQGNVVSPFHDIPLYANEEKNVFNMVVEVPRWTNAKLEISKDLPFNPITQDQKKGKARFVHNCFPHHGYIWNYGALPQTWENPEHVDKHTNCKGDNDPIDVCEIGERVANIGEVIQVKILGCMAMIDEGETDWKVIVIDVRDPLAAQLNDIEDIEKVMPGQLAATNEWFRIYKMPAGNPENTFAFGGEAKNKEFATAIVNETHEHWKHLITGELSNAKVNTTNTTNAGTPKVATQADARAVIEAEPEASPDTPLDPSVHKWHYIRL
jgi:inorganic pyrophosphatase